MRLHLRLDRVTPTHIYETVFFDGANCGQLVLRHGEYQLLGACILLGADRMRKDLLIEIDKIGHDKHGNFEMPLNSLTPPRGTQ